MLGVGTDPGRQAALSHRVLAPLVEDLDGGKFQYLAVLVLNGCEVLLGIDHPEGCAERQVTAVASIVSVMTTCGAWQVVTDMTSNAR